MTNLSDLETQYENPPGGDAVMMDCPECDGYGFHDDIYDCDKCFGTGKVEYTKADRENDKAESKAELQADREAESV